MEEVVGVLLTLALVLLGSWWATRLRVRNEAITVENALEHAPELHGLGFVMVVLGGLALAAYVQPRLLWVLPLSVEAHFSTLVWRSVVGVMALGFSVTTALAFIGKSERRWLVGIASLAVLLAVTVLVEDRTRPLAPELLARERDGVVLQSSGASCVSASAANLLRLHGVEATEREMAERIGATRDGATSAQLVYGLTRMGLSCERTFDPEHRVSRVKAPAVIFYGRGFGVPHAVVLSELNDDGAVILDPLQGRGVYGVDDVAAAWDGEVVSCGRGR